MTRNEPNPATTKSKRFARLAVGVAATALLAGCSSRGQGARRPPPPDANVTEQAYAPPGAPAPVWSSAYLYLPGSVAKQLVKFQVVNGMAMMEGDIKLGNPAELLLRYGRPWFSNTPGVQRANSVSGDHFLWPGGVMPYEVDSSVGQRQRGDIAWAVSHVNTTELNLRPRTSADSSYVVFRAAGGDCSSYVGRIGGAQTIDIGGCGRGSIPHEILHAAGFYHEQSRLDRDEHVTIHWNEISPGNENNFHKNTGRSRDVGPYDYSSIMHYSARAFSRSGRPTITPKVANAPIGQRDGLSQLDRAGISALYGNGPAPGPNPQPAPNPQPGPNPGNGSFGGQYTSERGNVTCTQSGSTVSCQYQGGGMLCSVRGEQLDCAWSGGGTGRAVFNRQANGVLSGSYGDLFSNNNRGAWNLTPTGGTAPPPQPPAPGPQPPAPTTPPAPTGPAGSLSGNFDSNRGPLSCVEKGAGLNCTFNENGAQGRLDCWNDTTGNKLTCTWATFLPRPASGRAVLTRQNNSDRNLSGTWGTFMSADNGGTWTITAK